MYKEIMLKREELLSEYATKDKDAIRIDKKEEDEIRPNFFRDTDRIIYSLSYTRYIDKTQVFTKKGSDHISKRIIHVQFVSKIARTIGRALSLNEDLIEAIALGHDIGHVPYGHLGEQYLQELSLKYNEGYFMHNVQSVRTLLCLEDNGLGKNLTIQTLDGILCHNGEFVQDKYYPRKKSKEDFLNDYNNCYKTSNYYKNLVPMTLEGCVVRISDIIGYLGRDIEDAIRLNLININDIPLSIRKILGSNNHDIISHITTDIIKNSYGKNYICMSKDIYKCIKDLKEFNYQNIYYKANSKEEREQIKEMFKVVFENCLEQLKDKNSRIYNIFLNDMNKNYINNTSDARKVIDYIAGMTDEYFINEYKRICKK